MLNTNVTGLGTIIDYVYIIGKTQVTKQKLVNILVVIIVYGCITFYVIAVKSITIIQC